MSFGVVHLHHGDNPGWGGGVVAMQRLHGALLEAGIESTILCGVKSQASPRTVQIPRWRLLEAGLKRVGRPLGFNDLHGVSAFGVRRHPAYRAADIVHIQGLHGGFFNYLALPALTLALGLAGVLVRVTRASVLEALGQDWVRTARAKGASEARAVLVHALPNALLPVTAVVGLQAGALLTGAVVTETIFACPGVGRLVVQAIGARDYPLVQGCVLVLALTYVVVNTLTDLLHALLDPRLRDEG